MEKIERAAAYIRVSTDEQKLRGYSLDAQRMKLSDYAKAHNLKIVDWYEDGGVSGQKKISKRPELQRMIQDAEKGFFDKIIFIKLDRFFRSVPEYYECMNRISPVTWVATEETYDLSTASGEMFFNVKLSLAQMEAKQTGERIMLNNEYKVREGFAIVGKGSLPFGFTVQKMPRGKIVVIDKDEEPIARDIIQHYITHQSKRGTRAYINSKYGISFTEKRLNSFLRSELLYGKYRDNLNYCEPYIDRETFRKIKDIEQRNVRYDYRQKFSYIFTGLIKCPVCGKELVGYTAQQKRNGKIYKYQKYRCSVNRKKERECSFGKGVTQNVIESQLLDVVETFLHDQLINSASVNAKIAPQVIDTEKINAEIDRLNYSWQTGKIRTVEQYEEQYNLLNNKLQKAIQAELSQPNMDFSHIERILSSGWRGMYDSLDTENKRAFWRSFIESVEIEWTTETKKITNINFF